MAIATDMPSLESLESGRAALRAELARLRRRLALQLGLEYAVDAAAILTATAAVLVLLDWWFRIGLAARLVLLAISLVGVLGFLGVRAARRWRAARLDGLSLAVMLDRYRPGTGQRIADVLQLPDLLDEDANTGASPAMVKLAVRHACEALAESDWRTLWNRKRTGLHAGALLLCVLVPVVFAWRAPEAARLSLARWLLGSNERWPQRTYLSVVGLDDRGRLLAPRDERVVLEVRSDLPAVEHRGDRWFIGDRDEPLLVRGEPKSIDPKAVRVRERGADGNTRSAEMIAAGPGKYRYELPAAPASSRVDLTGGDDWLGPLTVERVDRPTLADIRLRVKEPGSKGFRKVDDPRQNLLFLPDTEVELTLVGSEPVTRTKLDVHPGRAPDLRRVDDTTFAASWTLREATTLEVLLTSSTSGLESKPAFLSIGLLRDREPRVTLRAVGVGSHVTPVATIPLNIGATDDFGMAALRLKVERTLAPKEPGKGSSESSAAPKVTRKVVDLELPSGEGRPVLDHQVRHDMVLQTDPPEVGTLIRIVAEADDKCARGTQTGRSSALALQVVSPDELFYEILIRQRAERTKFITALEAAEKQTPIFAGRPTPADFTKVMRVHHSNARQLEAIAGRIADSLQEMKLNQIGSPKSHRLLQEGVIEPLHALTSGPLNELRSTLQSLSGTTPKAGADRETARKLHDEVVAKMKGILEQMSQWESFVDVVNQVTEVIRLEKNVLKATEDARESRTKEVFDEGPK
ncbi:MAG TPA: hypothetical protein VG406_22480 [Isosphaeraceae bacterium]|nr:hypothetical protein [Isosphaeraceae bacterium]